MTKVNFYIVPSSNYQDLLKTTCRITEKAWKNNHKIHIETDNHATTDTLHEMLWTFRDNNFIPHAKLHDNIDAPVIINHNSQESIFNDVLVNLSNTVPPFYQKYNRIIELIHQNDQSKKLSRQHYKFYQENNCELEVFNLT